MFKQQDSKVKLYSFCFQHLSTRKHLIYSDLLLHVFFFLRGHGWRANVRGTFKEFFEFRLPKRFPTPRFHGWACSHVNLWDLCHVGLVFISSKRRWPNDKDPKTRHVFVYCLLDTSWYILIHLDTLKTYVVWGSLQFYHPKYTVSNAPKYFLEAVILWESIHFQWFISCAFVLLDQLVAKALVGTLRHHLRRKLDTLERIHATELFRVLSLLQFQRHLISEWEDWEE